MREFILLSLCSFLSWTCIGKSTERILQLKQSGSGFSIDFRESGSTIPDNMYSFFKKARDLEDGEKIEIIKELLSFKGDLRKCSDRLVNYNKNLSQFYEGSTREITIEVQALFLINQIYFDNPFYYSPYSILIDTNSREEIMQNADKMNLVFESYKTWFDSVLKYGLAGVKKRNIKPLNYSMFKWIYGIDIVADQPLQFKIP